MGSQGLVKFWQSIINKHNIMDQLIPVMDVEDCEERTFKLLCQTLFLLVMEMKQEQDEECKLREGVTCRVCREKLSGNDEIIGKEELPVQKNENIQKAEKIADKTYKTISRSPPSKKALRLRKRVEVAGEKEKAKEDLISPHIIVHETLSLDENPLHVNVEKRKVLSTQTVMVPETLAMDFTVKEDDDADFFDVSIVSKENTSPKEGEQDIQLNAKLSTPVKDNSLDSTGEESPILGKQNKASHPRVSSDSEKLDIPKKLEFEHSSKAELPEPVVSEKNDLQTTSMPRYSPLVFTHAPSVMDDETDLTSPSILPGASSKNSEFVKIQDKGSPFLATLAKKPPVGSSSKAKKCLQKSASSFNVSPKEKVRKLQRHHTLDKHPKQSYEICLEPPGQQSKKTYRQTKISADAFHHKTGKKLKDEEDEGLRAAMMESLKSKMVEDMMRKKEKALQGLEYGITLEDEDEDDRLGVLSIDNAAKVNKRQNKEKNKRLNSPIKLPKLSPTKHASSPQKIVKSPRRDSPIKKLRQTFSSVSSPVRLRSSPRKHASCSTRSMSKTSQKEQSSPRKRQAHTPDKNNRSPPKKRRTDDPASHPCKKRVLAMDQLLKEVNESPVAQVQSVKQEENCTGQRKVTLGRNKKQFFDNSFDIVPTKNVEPNYAYQGEVVRKKEARKNLEGWECHECKEWYENQNLDPEEKKRLMNKCSRHRSKHNLVTNTPENFWDPGWVD